MMPDANSLIIHFRFFLSCISRVFDANDFTVFQVSLHRQLQYGRSKRVYLGDAEWVELLCC